MAVLEAPVPRLRRHPALLALAMGVPVLEVAVLWATGSRSSFALAPQVSAPEPFGVFHDLRWLFVFHSSWTAFGLELAALLAVRTTLTVALVRAAWPVGIPRPPLTGAAARTLVFVVIGAALMTFSVGLLFAAAVAPISWLLFAGLPPAVFVALLIHGGVVMEGWWHRAPPARTVGWAALTFVVLTLAGATLSALPTGFAPFAAAAAGLFNAMAWIGIVNTVVVRGRRGNPIPVAPIGVALLAAVIVGGTLLGFEQVGSRHRLEHAAGQPPTVTGQPVLIARGFGSHWEGENPPSLGPQFSQRLYSYSGLTAEALPAPYRSPDTYASLDHLVALMAQQVDVFHRATGRPVSIVAESEGTIVTEAYLHSVSDPPVDRVVLLSPLVEPGRVYYPPDGEDGWGVAAGTLLRAISGALDRVSPLGLTPGTPLLRSIVDDAPRLRDQLRCAVPGVSQLALFPLADAVTAPHPAEVHITHEVVPAFHGGLLANASADRMVAVALEGKPLPRFRVWSALEAGIQASASAWQVPELPISANPAWDPVEPCLDRQP